jgi:hypothetical protein
MIRALEETELGVGAADAVRAGGGRKVGRRTR